MQGKTQKALIINKFGDKPLLKEDFPIPSIKDGELLIKVEASTINPADKLFIAGLNFQRPLPAVCGMEGTGHVVEAKGQALQSWVGKRVVFSSNSGAWCEYAVSSPVNTIEIDKDVPLSSASSGFVNPLTATGILESFKALGGKGLIHTAAASAVGKMLVKICKKDKIPLLNIVRKKEQSEILKKEGATHVIITEGDWQKELKSLIEKEVFNVIFDPLGGGPVTETLISHLPPKGIYHVYGGLEHKPLTLHNTAVLFSGVKLTGFSFFGWWLSSSEEVKQRVRSHYSALLKNELSTHTYKEIGLKDINEGLELSASKANQGKILIKL